MLHLGPPVSVTRKNPLLIVYLSGRNPLFQRSAPEGPECLYEHVHRQKPNRHDEGSTISRSRELLYVGKTLVFLSTKECRS
jgi:hypothetical protein